MKVLSKVRVFGLPDSVEASKYPMAVDVDDVNDEITDTTRKLGSAKIGSGHDNFLNGIVVQFNLTFTVKAWTEAERYHFFDFVSSQSTMHRITKFDLDKAYIDHVDPRIVEIMKEKVAEYNKNPNPEKYLEILYSNPTGFRLTARMTTNYRQLKTIVVQRSNHRLPEWRWFCEEIMELPHFKELCFSNHKYAMVTDINNTTVEIEVSEDAYRNAGRILLKQQNSNYGTLYYPDGGEG